MNNAATKLHWPNPWEWSEFLRVRRNLRIASLLMVLSIIGFIPAAWIVLVPTDPTFRPDLTVSYAWLGLVVCALVGATGHSIARRARVRFDQELYNITRRTRDAALARGIPLEVDLGETYPLILLSRQHRTVAMVGAVPLLIPMDNIAGVTPTDGTEYLPGAPHQPHLVFELRDFLPVRIFVIVGRGLGRSTLDQTAVMGQRLDEFLDPSPGWKKPEHAADLAAYVDSMRVT